MRQCWVGDIADFAKYGMLKLLAGSDLRLGVFWLALTTRAAPNEALVSSVTRFFGVVVAVVATTAGLRGASVEATVFSVALSF